MIIVAGGDSFIFGSELADCTNGAASSYSRNTFPALLSSGHYVCAAYPGNSNHDIADGVKRALEKIHGIHFVFVCWTWPSRDKLYTSKRVIESLQEYCEYHGLPYLFTCADNCLFEVLDTNKLNMDHWYMFPPAEESWNTQEPRGFYQWAVESNYPCGPDQHPLEQAHADAAKLMQGKFNEMVTKHLQQN